MPWTAAKAEMTLSPDREKAIAAIIYRIVTDFTKRAPILTRSS